MTLHEFSHQWYKVLWICWGPFGTRDDTPLSIYSGLWSDQVGARQLRIAFAPRRFSELMFRVAVTWQMSSPFLIAMMRSPHYTVHSSTVSSLPPKPAGKPLYLGRPSLKQTTDNG